MKKILLLLVLLFALTSVFGAAYESSQEAAMGKTGAAVTSAEGTYFKNPASLFFFGNKATFTVDLREKGSLPFGQQNVDLNGFFIGRNASLDLDLGFSGKKSDSGIENMYTFHKTTMVDFIVAGGWRFIGGGIGVTIKAGRTKADVEIRSGRNKLSDFITEGLLAEMYRDTSLTSVALRTGLGVKLENWSFGMLLDDFMNSAADSGSSFKINFKQIVRSMTFGLRFCSDEFSSRGRLNTMMVSFNAEMWDSFSESPEFRGGAEIKLQLSKRTDVNFEAGCVLPIRKIKEGSVCGGISANFAYFDIYCNAEVPFTVLTRDSNLYYLTLGATWKI